MSLIEQSLKNLIEEYKDVKFLNAGMAKNQDDKSFPKDSTQLSKKLRANRSNLENAGIDYIPPNDNTRKNDGRYLSITSPPSL